MKLFFKYKMPSEIDKQPRITTIEPKATKVQCHSRIPEAIFSVASHASLTDPGLRRDDDRLTKVSPPTHQRISAGKIRSRTFLGVHN